MQGIQKVNTVETNSKSNHKGRDESCHVLHNHAELIGNAVVDKIAIGCDFDRRRSGILGIEECYLLT